MEIDVVIVGKDELDESQRVLGTRLLPDRISAGTQTPHHIGIDRTVGANGVSSFLPTVTATRYELSGASGGAGTLDWVINDVSSAPVSGVQRASVGGGLGYSPPSPPSTGAM